MTKVCVYTESLSPDFERAIEIAEEMGVENVDLRDVYGHSNSDITREEIRRIREALRNSSVELSCLSSVVFGKGLTLYNKSMYEEQLSVFKKLLDFCNDLDVKLMRIFTFDKPNAKIWVERPNFDVCMNDLVSKLEKPVRLAEEAGVTLAIETEGECYIGTSEEARRLIDTVGSSALRVCWDVLNAWRSGEIAYPDGYENIRDFVVYLHCKDAPVDPSTKTVRQDDRCLLGTGNIPYREILQQLSKDGYKGVALAERHYSRLHSSADESDELMKEIRAEINAIRGWLEEIEHTSTSKD